MSMSRRNEVERFRHQLDETIAWCTLKDWAANPVDELRTPQLRPSELPEMKNLLFATGYQRQHIVEQLATRRAALLQAAPLQPIQSLTGGRLLAFNPSGSTSDGAIYDATQGFIDGDNIPAWDTWIFYVIDDLVSNLEWWRSCDSYLLSWVPASLVDRVEAGILGNSDNCVRWAMELDTTFMRQLQEAGLVR